jgi:hypothetical protein
MAFLRSIAAFGVCSCPAAAAAAAAEMNDVKYGLAQVHGILQSNADSLKDPMGEQSTKAIIELELTVQLLLSGAGMCKDLIFHKDLIFNKKTAAL